MNTKAYYLIKNGKPEDAFQLRDFILKSPKSKEVVIECEAFGLNYADVMARIGLYQDAPPIPCVIGYEVVGKIIAIGEDVSSDLIGKRVVAFTRFGGYSKHAITSIDAIQEIGQTPANEALSLATQGATAYYMACCATTIQKNDIVLIHAASGGVGSLLIQLAKNAGAIVIAKVGNASKIDTVLKLGADFAVDYSQEDYELQIKRILGFKKLSLSFNPVGGSTYKKDLRLLGNASKLILFGGSELSAGKWGIFSKLNFVRKMGFFTPIALMMQSRSIIGVNMLKIADLRPDVLKECLNQVIKLHTSGKLNPISGGEFDVLDLAKAHHYLEEGKSSGKLSIHWN